MVTVNIRTNFTRKNRVKDRFTSKNKIKYFRVRMRSVVKSGRLRVKNKKGVLLSKFLKSSAINKRPQKPSEISGEGTSNLSR